MEKDSKKQKKVKGFRIVGMILPSLPSLLVNLSGSFLRLKRRAKKGGRTFQKELLRQGINASTAAELTEIYLESSAVRKYLSYLR
jgi:hypothetical protein